MVLLVTAGYFWVLGGTRGLLGGTGVHRNALGGYQGYGGGGATWGSGE